MTSVSPPPTCLHDLAGVEAWRRALRLDPHDIKRVRRAFFKNHQGREAAVATLPVQAQEAFAAGVAFHSLSLAEAHDSEQDGATKLVFRTADDLRLETVILRVQSGRTALCVSSQVGCAADCAFCATGKLGLRRNLSAAEILDQIVQANLRLREEGRSVRNVVFMGMGEPFHNEAAVHETLAALEHGECFHHPLRRVSVSTVGIPAAMVRCAQQFPRVRIALSLHSARPEVRGGLIPLANRYGLDELRAAVAEITAGGDREVMVEYLMLADRNDGEEDLQALLTWCSGLAVHINLIPYNPILDAPDLRGTQRPRREAFARALKAAGHPVTLRYSLGADVAAACGQLVREENRRG